MSRPPSEARADPTDDSDRGWRSLPCEEPQFMQRQALSDRPHGSRPRITLRDAQCRKKPWPGLHDYHFLCFSDCIDSHRSHWALMVRAKVFNNDLNAIHLDTRVSRQSLREVYAVWCALHFLVFRGSCGVDLLECREQSPSFSDLLRVADERGSLM